MGRGRKWNILGKWIEKRIANKRKIIFFLSLLFGIFESVRCSGITKCRQTEARILGQHVPYGIYEAMMKRPLDIILSGMALILLFPLILCTVIMVKVRLGSPVIFAQERPGLNGKLFKMYKFRSMTDAKDQNGELLSDELRLTPFGSKLRSTSIDELPELFNVLKGDMSLVGPRPLLAEYLSRYSRYHARRHEVRPGITGLAQVSGRNSLSWREKFDDDVKYVDHITFIGDLKIIFNTIKTVFKRDGISSNTSVTMEKFMGEQDEEG